MQPPTAGYLAYLLRLRYINNASDPVWRLSLESPDRALQVSFRSLDEVMRFLLIQMGQLERKHVEDDPERCSR